MMCVVFCAWQMHNSLPLIIASNRDEFYSRPAAAVHWWKKPEIVAGKDLKKGGTWLGATRSGRFAFVTNYRQANVPSQDQLAHLSRGLIVPYLLEGKSDLSQKINDLSKIHDQYPGFNVIAGDIETRELYFASNRHADHASDTINAHAVFTFRKLEPGIYGLSNATLDSPWFKVEAGKRQFEAILRQFDNQYVGAQQVNQLQEALFSLLEDRTQADHPNLPQTGLPPPLEKVFSSIFIDTPLYGTRCMNVLIAANLANEMHYHFFESIVEPSLREIDRDKNKSLIKWKRRNKG